MEVYVMDLGEIVGGFRTCNHKPCAFFLVNFWPSGCPSGPEDETVSPQQKAKEMVRTVPAQNLWLQELFSGDQLDQHENNSL
jgi:hypothetical protein